MAVCCRLLSFGGCSSIILVCLQVSLFVNSDGCLPVVEFWLLFVYHSCLFTRIVACRLQFLCLLRVVMFKLVLIYYACLFTVIVMCEW